MHQKYSMEYQVAAVELTNHAESEQPVLFPTRQHRVCYYGVSTYLRYIDTWTTWSGIHHPSSSMLGHNERTGPTTTLALRL